MLKNELQESPVLDAFKIWKRKKWKAVMQRLTGAKIIRLARQRGLGIRRNDDVSLSCERTLLNSLSVHSNFWGTQKKRTFEGKNLISKKSSEATQSTAPTPPLINAVNRLCRKIFVYIRGARRSGNVVRSVHVVTAFHF